MSRRSSVRRSSVSEPPAENGRPSIRAINIGDAIDYLKPCEAKVGRETVKKLFSVVLPEPTAQPSAPLAFRSLCRQMGDALE